MKHPYKHTYQGSPTWSGQQQQRPLTFIVQFSQYICNCAAGVTCILYRSDTGLKLYGRILNKIFYTVFNVWELLCLVIFTCAGVLCLIKDCYAIIIMVCNYRCYQDHMTGITALFFSCFSFFPVSRAWWFCTDTYQLVTITSGHGLFVRCQSWLSYILFNSIRCGLKFSLCPQAHFKFPESWVELCQKGCIGAFWQFCLSPVLPTWPSAHVTLHKAVLLII